MISTGEGRPASLEEVLLEREARAAAQAVLLARHSCPVISMTLVTPGPLKDDARRRAVLDRAEVELGTALARAGFPVLARARRDGPAGPAFLAAVAAPAEALKRLSVGLEDGLPWGRVLDIDVVAPKVEGKLPEPLSRESLGLAPRRCLLCGRTARECMAARTHKAAELALAADALLARGIEA